MTATNKDRDTGERSDVHGRPTKQNTKRTIGPLTSFEHLSPKAQTPQLTWDLQPTKAGSLSAQLKVSATVLEGATADLAQHTESHQETSSWGLSHCGAPR